MDIAPDSVTEAPPPGSGGPPAVVSIAPDSVTEAPPGLQPPPFTFTYIAELQKVVGVIDWSELLWSEAVRRGEGEFTFTPSLATGAEHSGTGNSAPGQTWGEITGYLEFEYTGPEQAVRINWGGGSAGVNPYEQIHIYAWHDFTPVGDPPWDISQGTLLTEPLLWDFTPVDFIIPASVAKRVGIFIVLNLFGHPASVSNGGLIENLP